jgi:predicted transcriptional regulator
MTTVQQLLDQKGRKIWSIHPDATVFDAVAKMAEKDVGSLVVMDGDELVGIITKDTTRGMSFLRAKHLPQCPCGTSWRDTLSLRGRNNPLNNAWRS